MIRLSKLTSYTQCSDNFGGPVQSIRIAVLVTRLEVNGIQRMRLNLAREFREKRLEVDFVVASKNGAFSTCLPEGISVFEIARRGPAYFFWGLVRYLYLRQPTHVLSAYEDVSVMVVLANWLLRGKARVLVSTHNALWPLRSDGGWVKRSKSWLILKLLGPAYRKADAVVAVSKSLAQELSAVTKLKVDEIRVIYNPVIERDFQEKADLPLPVGVAIWWRRPMIGFFGRLMPQKRVGDLVRAFARVRASSPCGLVIVGEGTEERGLRALVSDLGVQCDVFFVPFTTNPFPLMKACDLVVLPSEYEGLGNVLIEAMACGTQVISTDCLHGPREILEGGRWGQLVQVGAVEEMHRAIERCLGKEFWVDPADLQERAREFSAVDAAGHYLSALGISGPIGEPNAKSKH